MIESVPVGGLSIIALASVLLVFLAIFGYLWEQAGWVVVSWVVRGLVKLGVINPDSSRESPPGGQDRGVMLFFAVICSVSRLLPGDEPAKQPWLIVIPVLVISIPVMVFLFGVFAVVPAVLFESVASRTPDSVSVLSAFAVVVAYYFAVVELPQLWRRFVQSVGVNS